MANRSVLYAMDRVPSNRSDPPGKATGLSEWGYDIPLSYRLLVSGQPRVCALVGVLYGDTDDPPLALAGEADGGHSRLCRFLDLLAATPEASGDAEFLSNCAETKAFLASHQLGYYYLDTSEIDCLSSAGSYRASVEQTLQEIVELAALVDQLSPSTIEQAIAPGGPLEGVLLKERGSSQGIAPVFMQSGPFTGRELPALGLEWIEWDAASAFEKVKVEAEQRSAQRAAAAQPQSRSSPMAGFLTRLWRR
jgi:hypothetical protein